MTSLISCSAAGAILVAALLLPSIMGFFGKNKFDVNGKTVLLTGASEGMGKSVGVQLAQKGANVVIVARTVGKLETAIAEIQSAAKSPSQRFKYISADLSLPEAAPAVIAEATTWNNGQPVDVVWCMAGASYPSLFLDTPAGKARQQMDVNYWTCWDMAQAVLSQWLSPTAEKGKERHLVFTSSVLAFYATAGYGPYSPSKAAIRSLSDTLVQEVLLYGEDVKIHTVFPGSIQSNGFEEEKKTKPEITFILEESDPIQSAEVVAANAISGLENGDYLVTVGWLGSLMRSCAWGGVRRNNWVLDTVMTWIVSIVWFFIGMDLDGKVRKYGREHGHPM
ncbi:3-ketodihydrosphingosine reductase-like protein tsc10 [Coleophoma crateriformis]|uniref:3-dehydrosphinganine reductase n=1 Tax=Coleophoma crateriformis TaxID=565419 RepID=A0A3D8SM61_9HELO|nr:3-ketodihydrosphingosine reductase-like protein tsc10 [Coleophoma crateriformis]